MMLRTVENNLDMALSMFEVTLRYYNLFTQAKGDKKLIQTCYNKAKQGGPTDLQSMFIDSKNLLGRHPCVDRGGYLNISPSF
jgi:hypothetical protein